MQQPTPTMEVTCNFLNGLLQLVAGFPLLLLYSSTKQVLLTFITATLLAVLWQRLCTSLINMLLDSGCINFPAETTQDISGNNSFFRRLLSKARRSALNALLWILATIQSGGWVWFLVLLLWFPATNPTMQVCFKPNMLKRLLTKLLNGTHLAYSKLLRRPWLQPQRSHGRHESTELELQRVRGETL